jgi:uncharacterized protein
VPPPRLLADEMVGRLARYLRMVGCDTTYARGWADDEIVRVARAEGRVVLTRDRALAARAERAVLLRAVDLPGQVRQVLGELPGMPREVAFDRCTICNGPLVAAATDPESVPAPPSAAGGPPPGVAVFACQNCGHRYWEGSHTAAVRRRLAEWATEATA